jgi:hypothetical protein
MTFSDHSSKLEGPAAWKRRRFRTAAPGEMHICDMTIVQLERNIIGKSRTGYRNQTQAV